ncbi:MAG: hypothetical protein DWQ19_09950 [Crenarchaeota archaeon]|nr:MAG: hypothetical protein DWQ19_09950 [Thermoproteota archaeon]
MKISTKQVSTPNLLLEQVFADEIHIGLISRSKLSSVAPMRAYYIKNGCKIDAGTFSGKYARRDAKTAIIDMFKKCAHPSIS